MSSIEHQSPNPERETNELTPEAREVVRAFQQAKAKPDRDSQMQWLYRFYLGLAQICGSQEPKFQDTATQQILGALLDASQVTLHLASGTSGQRISLESREPLNETDTSKDGRPRWLWYPKPTDRNWTFGGQYWNNFMEHFGSEVVDLAAFVPEVEA